jgi:hypothetical protein
VLLLWNKHDFDNSGKTRLRHVVEPVLQKRLRRGLQRYGNLRLPLPVKQAERQTVESLLYGDVVLPLVPVPPTLFLRHPLAQQI